MNIRIQRIRPTVKALQAALQNAYALGDVRLVRRIRVLLEYGHEHLAREAVIQAWGISRATFYNWWAAFMQQGMDSLTYRHGGGRPPHRGSAPSKRSPMAVTTSGDFQETRGCSCLRDSHQARSGHADIARTHTRPESRDRRGSSLVWRSLVEISRRCDSTVLLGMSPEHFSRMGVGGRHQSMF